MADPRWKPGEVARSKWSRGQREMQQAECLTLYLQGKSHQEIADLVDLPRSTVTSRIRVAMEAMKPHALVDEYRARQIAELLTLRTDLMRLIADHSTDPDKVVKLGDSLLRVHDREAKLLNLDKAPRPLDDLMGMTDAQIEDFLNEATAEPEPAPEG